MSDLHGWTIAFDLDGTLVDTAPDLVRALNAVLMEEGLEPAPYEDARLYVGHGARRLLERGAARVGAAFTEPDMTRLVTRFVDIYRADIAAGSRAFPALEPALDALSDRGARLAVCTNKRTDLSEDLLRALALRTRFAAVLGADLASRSKPDPAHLQEAVALAGGDLARTVFVGDSRTDYDTALAAGAPIVMVSFGYSDEPSLAMPKAAWIDSYAALGLEITRLVQSR